MSKRRKPQPTDFELLNAGEFLILFAMNDDAVDWIAENIGDTEHEDGPMTMMGGVCVEPRYMDDIYHGLTGDGFTIKARKAA